MKKRIKDWTILIYANGSNELQPEMWQSKIDSEKIGSNDNMNIVIQISREATTLVKIMRPTDNIRFQNENWTGVRQYYILKGKSELVNDLGNINMADPHTLYNFIACGMKTYPAKKFMLILSGHGSPFTAILPDFSQNIPYAMGVTEMCKVINMIKCDIGYNIDILILDICDMNSIEILYELGKNKINTVKSILTYINDAPISGIPYDKLIYIVQKNNYFNTDIVVKKIIDNIQLNLIGIKLNNGKLKCAKKIISDFAYLCLTNKQYEKFINYNLLNCDDKSVIDNYFSKLNKKLIPMIISYKNISSDLRSLIKLNSLNTYLTPYDEDLLSMYCKLSFAKNNNWTYIFGNKRISDTLKFDLCTQLLPIKLPLGAVKNLISIMNPNFNEEKVNDALKKLYKYKKWDQL